MVDDRQIIPLAAKRAEIIVRDNELGVLDERPPTRAQTVMLARALVALISTLEESTNECARLMKAAEAAEIQLRGRQATAAEAQQLLKYAKREQLPVGWYWTTHHAEARLADDKTMCRMELGQSMQSIGMVPPGVEDAVRARSARRKFEHDQRVAARAAAGDASPA